MAADSLIDEYLQVLGTGMHGRRDRADLLDEVADHLHSAAERLEAVGVDPETAQRRALARFGEPRLVAGLLTSVPSKGNLVTLFFSRHLGATAALAAVLWAVASVAALYGFTDVDGAWTSDRYLLSAMLISAACLVTTAVLVGMNLRATGAFDGSTIAIAALGVLSAAAALVLAWAIIFWLPLLAAAVTWTMARARRSHAGSRTFVLVLLVAAPLIGIASIAVTLLGQFAEANLEFAGWALVAGMGAVLLAALADLAVRLARRVSRGYAVPA